MAEPSKCPQKPFASTVSVKRTEKMAQFIPEESSLGTVDGRVSDREVAVDIAEVSASGGPITC